MVEVSAPMDGSSLNNRKFNYFQKLVTVLLYAAPLDWTLRSCSPTSLYLSFSQDRTVWNSWGGGSYCSGWSGGHPELQKHGQVCDMSHDYISLKFNFLLLRGCQFLKDDFRALVDTKEKKKYDEFRRTKCTRKHSALFGINKRSFFGPGYCTWHS